MPDRALRFRSLLEEVLASNPFYAGKYQPLGFSAAHPPRLEDLASLPFTSKAELSEDQARHPPFGSDLTFPRERYTRLHQTSGTTGRPLRWLDTAESWEWWLDCWREVYQGAGVQAADRVFVAFSFGPFIGFWAAFEAAQRLGAMVLSGGGLSSEQRLESLLDLEATVLVCTPTYALRLAEVARSAGRTLDGSAVRVTLHAGEPGAGIPSVRARLEEAWGARCFDHAGATEVGAWGFGCPEASHLHLNEEEFIAEVVDPQSGAPATSDAEGVAEGELVLTNLGRRGSPVVRYRTGDLVRLERRACPCGRRGVVLQGGVLGRVDGMLVVRGVNVFPSALENLVRERPEIGEFQVRVERRREMDELLIRVEVEPGREAGAAEALARRVHHALALRPRVEVVPWGTLPRWELKARRFLRTEE